MLLPPLAAALRGLGAAGGFLYNPSKAQRAAARKVRAVLQEYVLWLCHAALRVDEFDPDNDDDDDEDQEVDEDGEDDSEDDEEGGSGSGGVGTGLVVVKSSRERRRSSGGTRDSYDLFLRASLRGTAEFRRSVRASLNPTGTIVAPPELKKQQQQQQQQQEELHLQQQQEQQQQQQYKSNSRPEPASAVAVVVSPVARVAAGAASGFLFSAPAAPPPLPWRLPPPPAPPRRPHLAPRDVCGGRRGFRVGNNRNNKNRDDNPSRLRGGDAFDGSRYTEYYRPASGRRRRRARWCVGSGPPRRPSSGDSRPQLFWPADSTPKHHRQQHRQLLSLLGVGDDDDAEAGSGCC